MFRKHISAIPTGRVSKGKDLYISRTSGNDSWSCEQKKPCKTIWRAVTLASRGDHIYVDGTNTDKDPYTCQSASSLHSGIYINKSLSLIGFGPMPPRIRCSERTSLTFDGSDSAQQMDINLSGLVLDDSFVHFQDSSVNIDSCKFEGSKRGVQFLIRTRMGSTIQITNSNFRENSECISVVVDSTKSLSHQISQVTFNLTNSSFNGNAMSDKGSCISFKELPDNNPSVSCNIALQNVTFSHNKFSSSGLVFLELDNGKQNINLQDVTFINNSPQADQDVLTGNSHSEIVLHSTIVNTFVNVSNFTGQNARLFSVNASKISLEIYKSSFCDHKIYGNGGVLSIRGTDLCKLIVTNSSFVNTRAGQGGAFNVECSKLRFSLHENSFTENMAMNGSGGVMSIHPLGSSFNSYEHGTNGRPAFRDRSSESEQHLQIEVTKCSFIDAYSFSGGGAVYINANKSGLLFIVESSRFIQCKSDGSGGSLSFLCKSEIQININNSHFISNQAVQSGGGLYVDSFMINDEHWASSASHIVVENSTFSNNSADDSGGAMSVAANKQHAVILQKVTMESNRAGIGGVAFFVYIFALKIRQSRFSNNTASGAGGVLYNIHVSRVEVQDSLLENNYVRFYNPSSLGVSGGALFLTDNAGTISITISIINTTFRNCSAQLEGGAIYLIHHGKNVSFVVQRSLFVENHSLRDLGGAIFLRLQPATEKGPGCNEGSQNDEDENYFSWNCKNLLRFEDATFVRNTGNVGGAIYLTTGEATFRNCCFVDNFASFQGGHVKTAYGTASLTIQGCLFLQTVKELHFDRTSYSKASFVHSESAGALNISNTTMDIRAYGTENPLMLITNGRMINVGNDDNFTKLYCPVGSQMKIVNFTTGNPYLLETIATTLEFSCSICKGNSYSLQRGLALGSQLVPGFQCLPCPFGANCSQNILAKRDFWGFEEQNNPPRLRFTMCPEGYCSPPRETNFSQYNGCQGNRFGDLCGHCSEGYTETLYSTCCTLSHQCNDYWFWPVALAYVSLMALYFTFRPPIVPWIKRQILWFKEHKPEDQDNNFDKGYLKILFFFYQAANLLVVSRSSQYFIKANLVEPIIGFFNFKLLSSRLICPFPGLTVVTKQLFSSSHVFGTLLMICAFYILHWVIQKIRGQGVPCVGPYFGGILQALLLGYTTLATVSFSLLRCVPIGTEKRLFYDGNVVCFQWWQYILIAFVCTFVVPFVFVLLWGSYKLYGGTLSVGKFLLACIFPLPSLIVWIIVSFFWSMGYPVNGHSTPSQISRKSLESVLYDSFKRPEDGRKLSLSWESIMIGRRLILVMMKAFVSEPLPRLLIMSLFCFLFLLHHVVVQPFRDSIANTTETISLFCIVVLATGNVFFASFLSLAVPFNAGHFSSWFNVFHVVEIVILCFAPAVFGFLVVIAVLSQLFRVAILICRVLYNFCWIWYHSCSNQDDEAQPLLAPVSQ